MASKPPLVDADSLAKFSSSFLRGNLSFSCTRQKMDIICPQNMQKQERSVVTSVAWLRCVLFMVTWKFRSGCQLSR